MKPSPTQEGGSKCLRHKMTPRNSAKVPTFKRVALKFESRLPRLHVIVPQVKSKDINDEIEPTKGMGRVHHQTASGVKRR